MNRGGWQNVLVALLSTLLLGTVSTHAQTGTGLPPNVVLIMADDIGYECFGCYGSRQYRTPNIDRLAAQGMRFTHCYSQPLCTPSRVKLMTGLSNARNYSAFSILNRDQTTFGHRMQAAGFATAVAGKWQLYGSQGYGDRFRARGTLPQDAGFDHSCLWQVDLRGERHDAPLMWIDGTNKQYDESHYGPQVACDDLCQFIRDHREQPFFAYYPMILPHNPFVPTPDSEIRDPSRKQKNFEDMVAYMDKLVGQVVGTLEDLGIEKQTLVLFTGDNGTNRAIRSELNGITIQGGKGLTTDAGTHVPLVAFWPGRITPGSTCNDLVDFSDFLPTILEATGQDTSDKLDGHSFFPQLVGASSTPREWIYCYYCPRPEQTKPVRFVRDHRWKLYGDGRFFDVQSDVLEQSPITDISSQPDAAAAHDKLSSALATMPSEGQTLLKFAP